MQFNIPSRDTPAYGQSGLSDAWCLFLNVHENERREWINTFLSACGDYRDEVEKYLRLFEQVFVSASSDLSSVEGYEIASLFSSSLPPALMSHVWRLSVEAACIPLGYDICAALSDSFERVTNLVTISKSVAIQNDTAAYIKRVSRAYLLGLDPECIVMCRGALEQHFESNIPKDDCIDILGIPKNKDRKTVNYTFDDLLRVAKQLSLAPDKVLEDAKFVRHEGNRILHQWPKSVDAFPVLAKTINCLVWHFKRH